MLTILRRPKVTMLLCLTMAKRWGVGGIWSLLSLLPYHRPSNMTQVGAKVMAHPDGKFGRNVASAGDRQAS